MTDRIQTTSHPRDEGRSKLGEHCLKREGFFFYLFNHKSLRKSSERYRSREKMHIHECIKLQEADTIITPIYPRLLRC